MMQVDPHTSPRGRVRKDTRTWAQRVQNLDDNWKPKIPLLVTAYLKYQHISSQQTDPAASTLNHGSDQPDTTETCTIGVLDIYSCDSTAVVAIAEGQTLAEALVTAGYLGTTPISPTLAISLKTLELFRCIRLFKASFSTEAFTKLLCHQYYVSVGPPLTITRLTLCQIPYRRYYRTALADAFDIYITIRNEVHQRVMGALGRSDSEWRAVNGCPACAVQVSGQVQLHS